jgi:hypothetical protein
MNKPAASRKHLFRVQLSDEQLRCVHGGEDGGSTPTPVTTQHEITSPRDPASGLPTGKRMHKPVSFT